MSVVGEGGWPRWRVGTHGARVASVRRGQRLQVGWCRSDVGGGVEPSSESTGSGTPDSDVALSLPVDRFRREALVGDPDDIANLCGG